MDDRDEEVYPMPSFVRLAVRDLDASLDWYRAVGFRSVFEMPVMAHVRYRRYADVMLTADGVRRTDETSAGEAADATRGSGVSLYFTLEDESADDVAARVEAAGLSLDDGPRDTGWNTRELTLRDPDGYELVFSGVLDERRSFEAVMGGGVSPREAGPSEEGDDRT